MDSLCLDFDKYSEHDLKNECGCKESMSVWWGSKDPSARNWETERANGAAAQGARRTQWGAN